MVGLSALALCITKCLRVHRQTALSLRATRGIISKPPKKCLNNHFAVICYLLLSATAWSRILTLAKFVLFVRRLKMAKSGRPYPKWEQCTCSGQTPTSYSSGYATGRVRCRSDSPWPILPFVRIPTCYFIQTRIMRARTHLSDMHDSNETRRASGISSSGEDS
jgi:hypothetical protein